MGFPILSTLPNLKTLGEAPPCLRHHFFLLPTFYCCGEIGLIGIKFLILLFLSKRSFGAPICRINDILVPVYDNALLLVDKPLGWSSFDVVKKLRNFLGVRKIGHAGTLDPLASGLLLIGTGCKTKALTALQEVEKWYRGDILLGKTTLSFDLETPLLDGNQEALAQCNKTMIAAAAASFLGKTMQQPPAYSAIKVKGVAAYLKARQGKATNLTPRPVSYTHLTLPTKA